MGLTARVRPRASWLAPPVAFAAIAGAAVVISLGTMAPEALLIRWAILLPLAVFGLGGWILVVVSPQRLDTAPVAALVMVLAAMELSAVASDGGVLSASAIWRAMLIAGAAIAAWCLLTRERGREIVLAVITGFVHVLIAVYILRVAILWVEWLRMGYPVTTLPIRPGQIGGLAPSGMDLGDLLMVLGPIALLHLWRMGKAGRTAAFVTAGFAIVCLLIVGSRAIWLACSVTCAAIVLATSARYGARSIRRTTAAGLGAVAVLGIAIAAVLRVARDVDEGRVSAYNSAVTMASRSPIFGAGPERSRSTGSPMPSPTWITWFYRPR